MKPTTLMALCLASVFSAGVSAQLVPPTRTQQEVLNAGMVIDDRGNQLEIYPTLRASREVTADGMVVSRVAKASVDAPFGGQHFGVVYNHSLGTQAYLTGEIAFKFKGTTTPVGFDGASYPRLTKLSDPNVYVVIAPTPADIPLLLARLKARNDLEWLEVVVDYGASANSAPALLKSSKTK